MGQMQGKVAIITGADGDGRHRHDDLRDAAGQIVTLQRWPHEDRLARHGRLGIIGIALILLALILAPGAIGGASRRTSTEAL